MDMGLAGKRALITGAAGGIGRATAEALAAEGARVIGVDLDADGLKHITALPPAAGGAGHIAIVADLSTPQGVAAAMQEALARAGGVDVFVSNAGICAFRPLGELTEEDWQHTLDVNLHAFRRAVPWVLPGMHARGGGAIVVNASDLALQPEGVPDYEISKAGLLILAKELADEQGPLGIRVNAVAPGPVRTGMWEHLAADFAAKHGLPPEKAEEAEERELAQRHLPLGGILAPRQVADAITWLVSARASGVTGTVLPLGGTLRSWH